MMLKNRKGMSLVELMVVLGIFTLAMSILFVPQIDLQKRLRDAENKMGRIASSATWKQKFATNSQELRSSAKKASNASLCPCIIGGAKYNGVTKECSQSACTANVETQFEFFENAPEGERKLSGLSNNPVLYTVDGDLCGADQTCAYRISSTYIATCSGGLSTCDHAESLQLTFKFTPLSGRTDLREESFKIAYPVNLNYPPKILTYTMPAVKVGETVKIAINGDPGHASETNMNFVFEKCEAAAPTIAEVKCYRFVNGVGQIKITGKSTGTTQIILQINDGELEDQLSNILSTNVTVTN